MLVGIPVTLVYSFAATAGETASASIWWYLLYGTSASAGGYCGWRWWRGKQQTEMPQDTPIHAVAMRGAAINTKVHHDIENQVHQTTVMKTISDVAIKDKSDIDAITDALEKNADEASAVAASLQSLLAQMLLVFPNGEHQQLIEQLRSLPEVHGLIQQNSALKCELEHYKILVHKLMQVIRVLHTEAKAEVFEAKLNR